MGRMAKRVSCSTGVLEKVDSVNREAEKTVEIHDIYRL